MLEELSKEHFKWIKKMKWTGSSKLSMLVLINSEIGEASNECREVEINDNFKYEIADIVLRILALMKEHNQEIPNINNLKVNKKIIKSIEEKTPLESMSVYIPKIAKAVKKELKGKSPWKSLNEMIKISYIIADIHGFDLNKTIKEKVNKNRKRGNKNRIV